MSILRLWVIGSAFVAVLILVAGWFLGVQPRLAEVGTATSERLAVAATNDEYEAVLVELRELSENLPALQRELDAIRVELPDEPALPELLGQLNEIAVGAGVSLNEVATEPPRIIVSEATEALGITDLVAIPVRVSAIGSPEGLAQFMKAAQFGPRLLWVGSFSTGDDAESGRVTLQGLIFVLPEEGAALPAVGDGTTEAPATEPPADPSTEPSTSPSP